MTELSFEHNGWTINSIASRFGGDVVGVLEGLPLIKRAAPLDEAEAGDVAFYSDRRFAAALAATRASCVFVARDCPAEPSAGSAFIKVDNPHQAFVGLLCLIAEQTPKPERCIHPSAVIDKTAVIAPTAAIMAGCVVGAKCSVGDNAVLYPNVVLYDGVVIGANTILHAGVICCSKTEIGDRCIINPGAVIGSDGFGYVENPNGSFDKIPHIGRVIIENDSEIGANSTIDRSVAGVTRIGKGVKIDNLVQIAHNVRIGDDSAIAAQTGIAGSAIIGRRARLAGQVGVVGHITLGDDVVVLAQSGVGKSLTNAGLYLGSPAQPHGAALRLNAVLRNLPDYLTEVRNELRKLKQQKTDTIDAKPDNSQ